jgi:hypothetical protein
MKTCILLLLFLSASGLYSQTDSSKTIKFFKVMNESFLDNFEILTGAWETSSGSIYHEEWKRNNDGSYSGKAYNIIEGVERNTERLSLMFSDGDIFYIADVPHNPAPVNFKLVDFNESQAVFENPEHDFPQRITYIFKDNRIDAIIEGPGKDGKPKQFTFSMERVSE